VHITNSPEYIPAIQRLYTESYSKGTSAQFVDSFELNSYLTEILQSEFALMFFENKALKTDLVMTKIYLRRPLK